MKFVEDFRNRYTGKEILIVGSGSSLADYPKDFLVKPEDKIVILVNYTIFAFSRLPEAYHWLASHPEIILEIKKSHPEFLKSSLLIFPFVPKFKNTRYFFTAKESLEMLNPHQERPIFLGWHRIIGNKKIFLRLLQPTVKAIMAGKSCKLICYSTIVHYAIEIAAIFGSKKITLIGCEGEKRSGRTHSSTLDFIYQQWPKDKRDANKGHLARYKFGTLMLAKEFKKYGVNVRRHFFKTGYREIE